MFIQTRYSFWKSKLPRASILLVAMVWAVLIGCEQKARGVDGDWVGILNVAGKLDHGMLHVRTAGDGKLTVSLDSRNDNVTGLAGDNVVLQGNQFSFDVPAVHGNYRGTLSPDGAVIKGTWTKDGSHPLDFTRQPAAPDGTSEP